MDERRAGSGSGPDLYDLGDMMELLGSPGPGGLRLLASAAPRLDGTWRVWVRGEDLFSPREYTRPDRISAIALMEATALAHDVS